MSVTYLPPAIFAAHMIPQMGMGATPKHTAFTVSSVLSQATLNELIFTPGAKSFTTLWAEPEIISEPFSQFGKLTKPALIELAHNVAKDLERGDEKEREYAVKKLRRIVIHLDPLAGYGFALKIADRLEDDCSSVRIEAGLALHYIVKYTEPYVHLNLASKVAEKIEHEDEKIRNNPSWVLLEIAPHLDVLACHKLAQIAVEKLEHDNEGVRQVAVRLLSGIVPHLNLSARPEFALKIAERVEDEFGEVCIAAICALAEIITHLPSPLRRGFTLIIIKALENKFALVRRAAVLALNKIMPHLDTPDRPGFALKIAEGLEDKDEWVRYRAVEAHDDIMQIMGKPTRFEHALKVAEKFGNDDKKVQESIAKAFIKIVSQFGVRDRLALLGKLVTINGLAELNMETMNVLCQRIPTEALLKYARHHGGDLDTLAAYSAAGIPFDSYFWKPYLNASDRAGYLEEIFAAMDEYRRGKAISEWTEEELHLGYAGLDAPGHLSFEDFEQQIQRENLSLPFLDESFTHPVKLMQSTHAQIDKGKLNDALKPLDAIQSADSFKQYILKLVSENKNELKRIRPHLDKVFPQGLEKLGIEDIIGAAPALLKDIWPMRSSSPVQDLILHLGFLMAWHQAGMESLKERMIAVHGKKTVSSETLFDGLVAIEEFYRDKLEEVMPHKGDRIRPIRMQRRILTAEIKRSKRKDQEVVSLDFAPSKSQADQFAGFVCEDCTKGNNAIFRDDFQIYRMILRHHYVGALYIQETVLDGSKVLVMVVQPRPFWTVDHRDLLDVVEKRIGNLAKEKGYDYALLVNDAYQQANPKDMLAAIEARSYRPISFKEAISGAIFKGNKFLVVWKRDENLKNVD